MNVYMCSHFFFLKYRRRAICGFQNLFRFIFSAEIFLYLPFYLQFSHSKRFFSYPVLCLTCCKIFLRFVFCTTYFYSFFETYGRKLAKLLHSVHTSQPCQKMRFKFYIKIKRKKSTGLESKKLKK